MKVEDVKLPITLRVPGHLEVPILCASVADAKRQYQALWMASGLYAFPNGQLKAADGLDLHIHRYRVFVGLTERFQPEEVK